MTEKQQALAAVESGTPARVSPAAVIKAKVQQFKPVIAKLLEGTGVTEENFAAQLANAYRAVPQLWNCEPETVLGASLKAAQLGLAPNDGRNLCWILPYGKQAQFQMGYGGVMELARRAVPGLKFDGRAVYPNDEFSVDYGDPDKPLTHKPAVALGKDRGGEAYAWYVRATFPDGSVQIQLSDREQIDYHRKFSKQPNGQMWTQSYDAAALKSTVFDLKRWLPGSPQLTAAFAAEEQTFTVTQPEAIADLGEIEHVPEAAA